MVKTNRALAGPGMPGRSRSNRLFVWAVIGRRDLRANAFRRARRLIFSALGDENQAGDVFSLIQELFGSKLQAAFASGFAPTAVTSLASLICHFINLAGGASKPACIVGILADISGFIWSVTAMLWGHKIALSLVRRYTSDAARKWIKSVVAAFQNVSGGDSSFEDKDRESTDSDSDLPVSDPDHLDEWFPDTNLPISLGLSRFKDDPSCWRELPSDRHKTEGEARSYILGCADRRIYLDSKCRWRSFNWDRYTVLFNLRSLEAYPDEEPVTIDNIYKERIRPLVTSSDDLATQWDSVAFLAFKDYLKSYKNDSIIRCPGGPTPTDSNEASWADYSTLALSVLGVVLASGLAICEGKTPKATGVSVVRSAAAGLGLGISAVTMSNMVAKALTGDDPARIKRIADDLTKLQSDLTDFHHLSVEMKASQDGDEAWTALGLRFRSMLTLMNTEENRGLKTVWQAVTLIHKDCTDDMIYIREQNAAAATRVEPLFVNCYGMPGCGKTFWINSFLKPAISGLYGLNVDRGFIELTGKMKYFPALQGKPGCFIDEYHQLHTDPEFVASMNQMISSAPMMAEGARLADKAQCFSARCVVTCSNRGHFIIPTGIIPENTAEAFWSRHNFLYIMRDGHVVNAGRQINKNAKLRFFRADGTVPKPEKAGDPVDPKTFPSSWFELTEQQVLGWIMQGLLEKQVAYTELRAEQARVLGKAAKRCLKTGQEFPEHLLASKRKGETLYEMKLDPDQVPPNNPSPALPLQKIKELRAQQKALDEKIKDTLKIPSVEEAKAAKAAAAAPAEGAYVPPPFPNPSPLVVDTATYAEKLAAGLPTDLSKVDSLDPGWATFRAEQAKKKKKKKPRLDGDDQLQAGKGPMVVGIFGRSGVGKSHSLNEWGSQLSEALNLDFVNTEGSVPSHPRATPAIYLMDDVAPFQLDELCMFFEKCSSNDVIIHTSNVPLPPKKYDLSWKGIVTGGRTYLDMSAYLEERYIRRMGFGGLVRFNDSKYTIHSPMRVIEFTGRGQGVDFDTGKPVSGVNFKEWFYNHYCNHLEEDVAITYRRTSRRVDPNQDWDVFIDFDPATVHEVKSSDFYSAYLTGNNPKVKVKVRSPTTWKDPMVIASMNLVPTVMPTIEHAWHHREAFTPLLQKLVVQKPDMKIFIRMGDEVEISSNGVLGCMKFWTPNHTLGAPQKLANGDFSIPLGTQRFTLTAGEVATLLLIPNGSLRMASYLHLEAVREHETYFRRDPDVARMIRRHDNAKAASKISDAAAAEWRAAKTWIAKHPILTTLLGALVGMWAARELYRYWFPKPTDSRCLYPKTCKKVHYYDGTLDIAYHSHHDVPNDMSRIIVSNAPITYRNRGHHHNGHMHPCTHCGTFFFCWAPFAPDEGETWSCDYATEKRCRCCTPPKDEQQSKWDRKKAKTPGGAKLRANGLIQTDEEYRQWMKENPEYNSGGSWKSERRGLLREDDGDHYYNISIGKGRVVLESETPEFAAEWKRRTAHEDYSTNVGDWGDYMDDIWQGRPTKYNHQRWVIPRDDENQGIESFSSIAGSDATEGIETALRRNTIIMTGSGLTVHGLMLKGDVGIAPLHIFETGLARAYFDGAAKSVVEAELFLSDAARDLAAFRLKDTGRQFRDITGWFISASALPAINGVAITVRRGSGWTKIVGTAKFHAELTLYLGGEPEVRKKAIEVTLLNSDVHTKPGDCGHPLLSTNPRHASAPVIGIHIAKRFTGSAITACVFKEDFPSIFAAENQGVASLIQYDPEVLSGMPPAVLNPKHNGYVCTSETVKYLTPTTKGGLIEETPSLELGEPYKIFDLGTIPSLVNKPGIDKESYEITPWITECKTEITTLPAPQSTRKLSPEVVKTLNKNRGRPCLATTQMARGNLNRPKQSIPTNIRDSVMDDMEEEFFNAFARGGSGAFKFLTKFQTLNGVRDGPLSGLNGVKHDASAGFLYGKDFKTQLKGDLVAELGTQVYDFAQTPPGDNLRSAFDQACDATEQGFQIIDLSNVRLKVELRPKDKALIGKTRAFECEGFLSYLVVTKYAGWFVQGMINNRDVLHYTGGANPYVEFPELFRKLLRFKHRGATDAKTFDKSIQLFVIEDFGEFLGRVMIRAKKELGSFGEFSEDTLRQIGHVIAGTVAYSFEFIDSSLVVTAGILNSGTKVTNSFGSWANRYMFLTVIKLLLTEHLGRIPRLKEIDENTEERDNGDDQVFSVSDSWEQFLRFPQRAETYLRFFGVVLTDPGKTEGGDIQNWLQVEDISFCSRFIREVDGVITAPLKKESIERVLHWKRIGVSMQDYCEVLESHVLHEAALWQDRKYYNFIRNEVAMIFRHLRLTRPLPTYDAILTEVKAASGLGSIGDPTVIFNDSENFIEAINEIHQKPAMSSDKCTIITNAGLCPVCDFRTTGYMATINHLANSHPRDIVGICGRCDWCGERLPIVELAKHEHGAFKCLHPGCSATLKNLRSLDSHRYVHGRGFLDLPVAERATLLDGSNGDSNQGRPGGVEGDFPPPSAPNGPSEREEEGHANLPAQPAEPANLENVVEHPLDAQVAADEEAGREYERRRIRHKAPRHRIEYIDVAQVPDDADETGNWEPVPADYKEAKAHLCAKAIDAVILAAKNVCASIHYEGGVYLRLKEPAWFEITCKSHRGFRYEIAEARILDGGFDRPCPKGSMSAKQVVMARTALFNAVPIKEFADFMQFLGYNVVEDRAGFYLQTLAFGSYGQIFTDNPRHFLFEDIIDQAVEAQVEGHLKYALRSIGNNDYAIACLGKWDLPDQHDAWLVRDQIMTTSLALDAVLREFPEYVSEMAFLYQYIFSKMRNLRPESRIYVWPNHGFYLSNGPLDFNEAGPEGATDVVSGSASAEAPSAPTPNPPLEQIDGSNSVVIGSKPFSMFHVPYEMAGYQGIPFDLKELIWSVQMPLMRAVVDPTMVAGTEVLNVGYGDMPPIFKAYVDLHEYMTGSIDYKVEVVGNGMFSGVIAAGAYFGYHNYPPSCLDPNSGFYNIDYRQFVVSGTGFHVFRLNNSSNSQFGYKIGNTVDRQRVTVQVYAPLVNPMANEGGTIYLMVYVKLGPDFKVLKPKPIESSFVRMEAQPPNANQVFLSEIIGADRASQLTLVYGTNNSANIPRRARNGDPAPPRKPNPRHPTLENREMTRVGTYPVQWASVDAEHRAWNEGIPICNALYGHAIPDDADTGVKYQYGWKDTDKNFPHPLANITSYSGEGAQVLWEKAGWFQPPTATHWYPWMGYEVTEQSKVWSNWDADYYAEHGRIGWRNDVVTPWVIRRALVDGATLEAGISSNMYIKTLKRLQNGTNDRLFLQPMEVVSFWGESRQELTPQWNCNIVTFSNVLQPLVNAFTSQQRLDRCMEQPDEVTYMINDWLFDKSKGKGLQFDILAGGAQQPIVTCMYSPSLGVAYMMPNANMPSIGEFTGDLTQVYFGNFVVAADLSIPPMAKNGALWASRWWNPVNLERQIEEPNWTRQRRFVPRRTNDTPISSLPSSDDERDEEQADAATDTISLNAWDAPSWRGFNTLGNLYGEQSIPVVREGIARRQLEKSGQTSSFAQTTATRTINRGTVPGRAFDREMATQTFPTPLKTSYSQTNAPASASKATDTAGLKTQSKPSKVLSAFGHAAGGLAGGIGGMIGGSLFGVIGDVIHTQAQKEMQEKQIAFDRESREDNQKHQLQMMDRSVELKTGVQLSRLHGVTPSSI